MTNEPQPANEAVSAWEEPVVEAHFEAWKRLIDKTDRSWRD